MDNCVQTYNNSKDKTKRIASNTILLFLRIFILTVVNLFAVRVVLHRLGEIDYGIYHSVAGVVMTTGFLSGVLAFSIQRFLSFYLGKQDTQSLQKIFSISINIVAVLIVTIFILLESVGLWFVNNQLTIPSESLSAVQWVYQFAILGVVFSLIQIPYMAAMFAHEDMGKYALVSTLECLLRLLAAYLVGVVVVNNLVFYSFCILIAAFIIMFLYVWIGHVNYSECRYTFVKDYKLYKEIFSFSGWALYGSVSNMGMIQGNTILLNVYFGPVMTTAFAISLQIYNAFNALCNSMVLAFRPPMIKAYAEGNLHYLQQLFSVSNKFLLYSLTAIAIPLIFEMPAILLLWLHYTSSNTILFARLMIIYLLFISMNNPISIVMHASGHIKQYNLPVETITLMCLPLTWLFFFLGFPAHFVFASMIGLCLLAHVVRLWCLNHYHKSFSILSYVSSLVLPSLVVISVGVLCTWMIHSFFSDDIWQLVAVSIFSPIIIITMAFCFGVSKQERTILLHFLKSFVKIS